MILKIQTGQNNPRLRQKAKEVKEITPEIKQLILDMEETLKTHDGLGLAAPQVGQSLKIIVINKSNVNQREVAKNQGETPDFLSLINPQIKKFSSDRVTMEEGCLSLPNIYGLVERPEKVTVEGLDIDGQKIKIEANGLLARVLQHEIDHLDGILFVDKLLESSRK